MSHFEYLEKLGIVEPISLDRKPQKMTISALGHGIRPQFPIFKEKGVRLAFLDSAASSQKPQVVIERVSRYLSLEHANIHRGAYELSSHATELFDRARQKVATFLGSKSDRSIVFGKNATEAINLVASSFGEQLKAGDVVLLTLLEHHSNIVPWQLLAMRRGIKVAFASINPDATLDLDDTKRKIQELRPKLVAISAHSNAFGTLLPIREVIEMAHKVGARVLVDGSQYIVHNSVNVQELDTDFFVFTGHKLYGPTGVGVLYGKEEVLESMSPFLGGGDMIEQVDVNGSTWAEIPRRFEAGTPAIAEVIGLGTAIEFVESIGIKNISEHEEKLYQSAIEILLKEPGIQIHGPYDKPGMQRSIIPFNIQGVHPHDLATIVDSVGAQIRSGHHCAMPALKALGLHSTARASLAMYSDLSDFEVLCEGIRKARRMLLK